MQIDLNNLDPLVKEYLKLYALWLVHKDHEKRAKKIEELDAVLWDKLNKEQRSVVMFILKQYNVL